jgi:hypothetical protein
MQILQKRNVAGMDGPTDKGKDSSRVATIAWSWSSVAGASGGGISEAEEEHSPAATVAS